MLWEIRLIDADTANPTESLEFSGDLEGALAKAIEIDKGQNGRKSVICKLIPKSGCKQCQGYVDLFVVAHKY